MLNILMWRRDLKQAFWANPEFAECIMRKDPLMLVVEPNCEIYGLVAILAGSNSLKEGE